MPGSTHVGQGPTRRWSPRRRLTVLGTGVLIVLLALFGLPGVASAENDDPDGDLPQSVLDTLEAVSRGYYDARAVLASSQARQKEISDNLKVAKAALASLSSKIGKVAAARYEGGNFGFVNGLINGQGLTDDMLDGAAVGQYLTWHDDSYIHEYRQLKDESEQQQKLLDAELDIQAAQEKALDDQKRQLEKALAVLDIMPPDVQYTGPVTMAQPAPRNPDGSFPAEAQNIPDPTTGGKITFRTWHMLQEAKNAGFTRFVSCWRPGTLYEHPKGRACDFSVFKDSGFVGKAATGDAKEYGSKLAAWAVANADALGVLYVIWYQQIWTPADGWHAYREYGDVATEHKNHVHISMR
jgi:hypothetical protein